MGFAYCYFLKYFMKNILIAGGTGLIGQRLVHTLESKGYTVNVLSRNPRGKNQYFWNPLKQEIDESCLSNVEVLINLSGAGIADKRWSKSRKDELFSSRIGTTTFLFSLEDKMPLLKHFISSSGINCYGYEEDERIHLESDPFGADWLSGLVRDWEKSADLFANKYTVAKVRTAVVFDKSGGALPRMLGPVKLGIGSALGSGKQHMPWIHAVDLVGIFEHVIDKELSGPYNAVAACDTNKEVTRAMADTLNKPFWFPNVPTFMMKLLFGEMASVLLLGLKASNEKIKSTGYVFQFSELKEALKDVLK
jgi:uncharacterized protein (TIGR01777 family)